MINDKATKDMEYSQVSVFAICCTAVVTVKT